nr:hypothetical protein [Tanacetum cinerariifolium]
MCDKKNNVLFTGTECVVLSPDFKLLDESQVLLKATLDKSNLWYRRLVHINFKTMNKLIRGNLVRGLPSKLFENNHTCVAFQKGKQHKASYKTKTQNGVAERKNKTLIEAARAMLADSKLPTTFWAEALNTACYVKTRVLVIKPHNKTPYELFLGNQTNGNAGTKANIDAGQAGKKTVPGPQYVLLPILTSDSQGLKSSKDEVAKDAGKKSLTFQERRMEFRIQQKKVEKALYGLHQAPRAWYERLSTYLLENGFRRGIINKTLFIKKDKGDILLMIGSLIYLTASRPEIMFAVFACARFQVTPKVSHLHAVKRIFNYLKGQPKLGLWYPRDSPFDLKAFLDSDYARASLDRKSTTREYVAGANCCGHVLWIQN